MFGDGNLEYIPPQEFLKRLANNFLPANKVSGLRQHTLYSGNRVGHNDFLAELLQEHKHLYLPIAPEEENPFIETPQQFQHVHHEAFNPDNLRRIRYLKRKQHPEIELHTLIPSVDNIYFAINNSISSARRKFHQEVYWNLRDAFIQEEKSLYILPNMKSGGIQSAAKFLSRLVEEKKYGSGQDLRKQQTNLPLEDILGL